ncbi:MAG: Ig-like domain-containing protein, partial [Bacteroidales bacterium]|nr:Ig-like domain-containing protein [Bacteroidales bacterium]
TAMVTTQLITFSAKGYLVLRKDNLAISKLVYNTYIFNRDYDGRLYNLVIEYREMEGKYYPQYISFGNYFKIRNRVDTSTFMLKQTLLRQNSQILELTFNRAVDTLTGADTSNFSVRYGKAKIPLDKAVVYKNIVRIQLKIDKETLKKLNEAGDLTLTIGELADMNGNRLAGKYNGCYQHREFFVNKIVPVISEEFPYSDIIPKTMPLYWNPTKPNLDFWNTYNLAWDNKLN